VIEKRQHLPTMKACMSSKLIPFNAPATFQRLMDLILAMSKVVLLLGLSG